jgi:phosphopantetheine adenylyltransferase
MDNQVTIILLSDARLMRSRQVEELARYSKRKEDLETKLKILRAELRLTEDIIKMIEKETVTNPIPPVIK